MGSRSIAAAVALAVLGSTWMPFPARAATDRAPDRAETAPADGLDRYRVAQREGAAREGDEERWTIEIVDPELVDADRAGEEGGPETLTIEVVEPESVEINRPGAEGAGARAGEGGAGIAGYELVQGLVDRVVFNTVGREVGELSNLIVKGDRIEYAIIALGGFLGIGGSEVVVPFDTLTFEEDRVVIETVATGSQLEGLTPFNPADFGIAAAPGGD